MALEEGAQLVGRQVSLSLVSQVRHRLYLSAVGLAGVWAVASLFRSASDFSAASSVRTPRRHSTSLPGFDGEAYLRRKGIDHHEVRGFAQERTTERQAIARSRARRDVGVAIAPLLLVLGVHRWLAWLTKPAKVST